MKQAEVRMTIGQLLQADPRPVGTVLMDALHTADAVLRNAQVRVTNQGNEVDAREMTRLLEALDRAAKLAKTVIDAGVSVKLIEATTRDAEAQGKMLMDAIINTVDPLLDLIPWANAYELGEWRAWVLGCAFAHLAGETPPPPPSSAIPHPLTAYMQAPVDADVVDEDGEPDQPNYADSTNANTTTDTTTSSVVALPLRSPRRPQL